MSRPFIKKGLEIRQMFREGEPALSPSPHPPPPRLPTSSFPTYRSKAVPLLQFIFVCASVVSYVAFVLSLLVPYLPFFCCFGRPVLRDCRISLVFSLIFLYAGKQRGSHKSFFRFQKRRKVFQFFFRSPETFL